MPRRNGFYIAISSLFFSQIVLAGPPVAYDSWSVANGVIDTTVSCSTTDISCQSLVSDNGMVYEEVTTPYYSFLRLILTEKDASGLPVEQAFSTETFVPYATRASGGIAQGAASKQVIRDAMDGFEVTAEVQKSNMRGLNASTPEEMFTTSIDQSFSNAEISSSFAFKNYTEFKTTSQTTTPDSNVERGRTLDISQSVTTGEQGDGKQQVFVKRQRKGGSGNGDPFPAFNGLPPGLPTEFSVGGQYFVGGSISTASSMNLPVTVNGNDTGSTAGISWLDREDISLTWISQSSNVAPATAAVGYQRVDNATPGSEASVSSLMLDIPEPANPFAWDTNFGAQP